MQTAAPVRAPAPAPVSAAASTPEPKPATQPARAQGPAPVQDLFSVPSGASRSRSELPITAPSPILAMQPQVAAEVAKSFATSPEAGTSTAPAEKTVKQPVKENAEKSPADES